MGYWPSVRSRWLDIGQVLFCVCTDRDEVEVHKLEKERGQYPAILNKQSWSIDQTNLVNKGFIIWLSGKFFLRGTAGSPERARWLHLTRSGSQSYRAIWFILPARGVSHIIINNYSLKWRWLAVDIYRAAKQRGKYPTLATDTEVNSCFSIY